MSIARSYDDIDPATILRSENRGPNDPANEAAYFFRAGANEPHDPTAFLVRMGSQGAAHYHGTDQFQIVVEGRGRLGRHELAPVSVHYSRGYTPYGPLFPDEKLGWGFLTLRTRLNVEGTQRVALSADKLKRMPDRKPWQASVPVSFEEQGLAEMPILHTDDGLLVQTLKLAPGAREVCPSPAEGDGQYLVVSHGSLIHEGKEHRGLTLVFIRNDEGAYTAQAGPDGLEALILNFPKPSREPPARAQLMACKLCAFTYDQTAGLPEDGIRPETPWEDVPETWTCPDCGAGKEDFEEVAI